MNKYFFLVFSIIVVLACNKSKTKKHEKQEVVSVIKPKEVVEFGFKLNQYTVVRDTIHRGDNFGEILQNHHLDYSKIYSIVESIKDSFDIRKLRVGKPYTLLCSKDSLHTPFAFVYQPNKEDYVVINLKDSISVVKKSKPVKYVEKEISGIITSSISQTIDELGASALLTNKLANDIYAWTIDFRHLQKGDRFKVIYRDKYIEDTIYAGIHDVKAAYFKHKDEPFYAFKFHTDSLKGMVDYFSEEAKNLRRAFLKSPIEFGRISSRYNLKRRIAYYGYRLRPHKGTDFAAPIGTPIRATASGTVIESTRRGGNGKFVKIRHNDTYQTQYLHMSKRMVRKGDL